jgi:hypothetical protein
MFGWRYFFAFQSGRCKLLIGDAMQAFSIRRIAWLNLAMYLARVVAFQQVQHHGDILGGDKGR